MTVAFITNDWAHDKLDNIYVPNGAGFYRCFLPMTVIPKAVMGRPRFSTKEGFGVEDDKYGRFGFDTVVLKLFMDRNILKQIDIAKSIGQRIICDVDDYFPGIHPTNVATYFADPSVSRGNWHVGEEIILAADRITVSTPFLKDYYSTLHPDVVMVRNGIDPAMFAPHRRKQQAKPVIGWMGATMWRSEDLEQMRDWLPPFIEKHRLRWHHSGHVPIAGYAYEKIGLKREWCSIQPMVPIHRLGSLMDFDIGVVPLNMVDFNRAKSALKGLEYAASGVPFVAQRLPEYELIEADGIGVTAGSDDEWVEHMTRLLSLKEREEAVERAYAGLPAHTIDARASEWITALTKL